MSQQSIPPRYLYPPNDTEIPDVLPGFERPSEDETLAAMMTRIDDHNDKVAGLKQGDLLYAWARQRGHDPATCAEVVRLTREQTRQAAETRRLESMAASAAANETAYTPHPRARTPVWSHPTNNSSDYHELATTLNSLVQTALPPDSGDLTDMWHDILQGVTPRNKVTPLLDLIKTNHSSLYERIITVLEENLPPSTDNVPEYTRPATSVNPIPFRVTPDNSGRTIPTTDESTFTGRSPPPPRITDASHRAVTNVREPTRESRSPRHTRCSSPVPSRSASPSHELVLVRDKRDKRRGSFTAMVMSRPSSPISRPTTPSRQSRHVSWAPSPEPATVGKSKTTVFDPKNGSATIIKRERTERPPASSSHTDTRRTQSTSHPGSVASKSKGHTHLTQRIDSKGKKQTHIHF